jgi:hypothetical protein
MLVRVDASVADIMKLVKGNGQPGLIQRVTALELWRSMLLGMWAFVAAACMVYVAVRTK